MTFSRKEGIHAISVTKETMENDKMEKTSLRGDIVLNDLMDKVCRNLYLRDLCRIARVCKSWNAAVQHELERRGMQKLNLYENLYNLQFLYRFKVKPHIVLLFGTHEEFHAIDPRNPYRTASFEFIKKYVDTTLLIGSTRIYTEEDFDTDHDKYDEDECVNFPSPNRIPCLIIPKHNKLNVKFVSFSKNQLEKKSFNHRTAINRLIPTATDTKTFLILFTFRCEKPFLKKSVNYVKERFQEKSYALWGSESFFPPLINDSKNGSSAVDQQIGFVGISISSNNMDLFSTVFSCENLKISGFYEDLLKFKNNVKLKKNSLAFINGPCFEDYYEDTSDEEGSKEMRKEMDEFYTDDYEQEYLYNFKKVFPDVPFISTFQNSMFKSFGNDTTGSNKFLLHDEAITIAILTFN